MKTLLMTVVICVGMMTLMAGCEPAYQMVSDPNSGLNVAVDAVEWIAPAVGGGAAATGTPWGALLFLGTTVLTGVIAAYKNHKKNLIIGGQDEEFKNVELVTMFMVDVVESLPEEAQNKFKEMISVKLKDNDFYKIGKSIILGLKG